jgi:5-phospho-D-xylono-1,4-lactonase
MSLIRTVLGDIDASTLGVCYAHEHIVIDRSFVTQQYPDFLLEDVSKITEELRAFHRAGGRAMVDSMPCGGGRNVTKLAIVSRESGVHILCPTGLHQEKYYPDGHWIARVSVEQLAQIFSDEIEQGIDANDTNGPSLERTSHRAGLIKVASELNAIGPREQKIFEAAAIAHNRTGAPILTHTEQGTAAMMQIDLFSGFGVKPSSVVISHLDRRPDVSYHREVLARGVFLEYDSAFRWKSRENPTRDLLIELAQSGFLKQLMLGMDAARNRYWASFGGSPGLTFLLNTFSRELGESGFSDQDLRTIFVDNPARAYALSPVAKETQAHIKSQSGSNIQHPADNHKDLENLSSTLGVVSE